MTKMKSVTQTLLIQFVPGIRRQISLLVKLAHGGFPAVTAICCCYVRGTESDYLNLTRNNYTPQADARCYDFHNRFFFI